MSKKRAALIAMMCAGLLAACQERVRPEDWEDIGVFGPRRGAKSNASSPSADNKAPTPPAATPTAATPPASPGGQPLAGEGEGAGTYDPPVGPAGAHPPAGEGEGAGTYDPPVGPAGAHPPAGEGDGAGTYDPPVGPAVRHPPAGEGDGAGTYDYAHLPVSPAARPWAGTDLGHATPSPGASLEWSAAELEAMADPTLVEAAGAWPLCLGLGPVGVLMALASASGEARGEPHLAPLNLRSSFTPAPAGKSSARPRAATEKPPKLRIAGPVPEDERAVPAQTPTGGIGAPSAPAEGSETHPGPTLRQGPGGRIVSIRADRTPRLVAKAVTTGKVRVHEVRVSGENLFEAAQFAIEKKSDCFAPFPKFLDVEEVEYTVDLGAGPAGVDAGIALDHAISKGSRGAVLLRVVQEGKADADRCEYVLAQVTDLGITAVASGRDVVAMVTRLADGVAVRGAEVRLEDPAAPGPVITSVTDESGVARLSLAPGTTTPQGLFIAAAFGTDIAVLPIDAPLATDLPPDCPVPSRSLTREYPELVAGEGSLGGGPGMAAGEGEGAGTSTGPIAVEVELVPVSVRSPKARVLGTCDSHPLLVGQEVVAKVRGYRKLDEPADYAAVAWRLTRRATARFGESLLAGTDLLFTDVDSRCAELARGPEEVAAGTGFLDGRGTLRVPLKLDVGARASCGSITFVFEATVTDLGSGPVAATAEVVAHAGERYAGVRVDALGALAGEDIVAEASLVGLSGAPLVFGDVTLTLWKQVPRTTGEPMGISVESCTSTSARLPVRCTFTLPEPGKYVVRSTTWDATGRPTRAAVEVASFGDGAALGVAPGTLLMVPEHGSYAPGETARVRLQAPFAEGAGMALALSGGVRHVLTFALSGGTSTIAFPVDPDMLNCPRVLALALPTMDSDVSRFVDTRTAVALGSLRVPVSTDFPPIQAGQSGRFGAPDGADEVCGQRLEMVFVAESRWEGEAYPASPSSPPVRLAGLPPEGGDEQGLATRPILPGEGGDGAHPASPSSPPIRPAGLPPEGGDEQGLATRPILPGGTGAARAFSVETVLACLVEEAALDRGPLDAQYDLLSRFQRPDGAFDLWPGFSSPDPVIAALVGVLAGGCGECEGRGVRYDRLAGYLRAVATFALAQDREDGSPLWETYGDLAIAVAGHALVDARRGELTSERLAQACAFLAPPDADSARKTAGHSPGAPKTGGDVASGPPKTAGNVASAPRKAPGTRRGAGKVVQQAPVLAQVWMLEAATLVLGKAARPEATGELSAASECADRMLAQIRKAAREQRGSAHILDRAPGTSPLSLSQAGRDAAVLRVLLATNPGEPLVDKIAKGLLDAQRDGRWGDHLADAVAVDALSAYYRTREQRSELVELAARSRLRCEPSHPAAPATAALPHADAKASGTAGGAAAKADAKASGTAGGAAAKAEDAGFGVEREVRCTGGVLAPYGPDTDSRSAGKGPRRNNRTNGGRRSALPARSDDEAYQGYVVGDPVEVVVRVRTRADRNLVVVEIPLPAGFGLDDSAPGPGDWSYAEVYDDRVVLYFDEMAAGTYEFTFGATATAAGEFYWPPVTAEEMRKPGAHGRSKATAVILGARGHCQRMIR